MTTVKSFKLLTVAVLAAIGFIASSANAAHESNWIFPNFAITDGTTLPAVDAGVEGNPGFEGVAMTRSPVQQPESWTRSALLSDGH